MYSECDFVEVCVKVPRTAANTLKHLASLLCGSTQQAVDDEAVVIKPMPKSTRSGLMLKGMRLRAGMTQLELAKRIAVPQAHISQYERNVRKIPIQRAELLAEVLETKVDDFL